MSQGVKICTHCDLSNSIKCTRCRVDLPAKITREDIQNKKTESRLNINATKVATVMMYCAAKFLYHLPYIASLKSRSVTSSDTNDNNVTEEEDNDPASPPCLDDDEYSAYVTEEHIIEEKIPKDFPPVPEPAKAKSLPASATKYALPLSETYQNKREAQVQTEHMSSSSTTQTSDQRLLSSDSTRGFFYRLENNAEFGKVLKTKAGRIVRSNSDKNLVCKDLNEQFKRFQCFPENNSKLDPYHLNGYVRLAFNLGIVLLFFFLIYSLYSTVVTDMQKKRNQEYEALLIKRDQCAINYRENRCDPSTRLPKIEKYCLEWEECMNIDPEDAFRRSALAASIASEVIGKFVDPLSLKSILFIITLIFGTIILINCIAKNNSKHPLGSHPEIKEIHKKLETITKMHCSAYPTLKSMSTSMNSTSEIKTPYMFNSSLH